MTSELTNKHLVWIDVAKGLGIFFIIFGHLSYDLNVHYVHKLIYSFHIPFFFILSGLVFSIKPGTNFFGFLKNKIRRILIPLIIFVFLGFVVRLCVKPVTALAVVKYLTYFNGTYYWNMPCWFFVSLFIVYIICYLIKLPDRKLWVKFVLGASFFLLGFFLVITMNYLPKKTNPFLKFGIDRIPIVLGFFVFGNILRDLNKKWSFSEKKHQLLLIPSLILAIGIWVLLGIFWNTKVSIYERNYGHYWSFVGSSIFGSIVFMIISIFISNLKFPSNVFMLWGKNTILIACTHYILRITRTSFQKLAKAMGIFKSCWSDLFMIGFIVALLMFYVGIGFVIDRYVPWITGANPTFYKELKEKRKQKAS